MVGPPKRKRGGRRRSLDDTAYYLVKIQDWSWSFSFGINAKPDRDGPYSDYRYLRLYGKLLAPAQISADAVEVILLPARSDELSDSAAYRAVGSLELYRGSLSGFLRLPTDAIPPILQLLVAERFRYVVLFGDKLRRGRTLVRSYELEMTVNENEYSFE